jgi:hypothetical protein
MIATELYGPKETYNGLGVGRGGRKLHVELLRDALEDDTEPFQPEAVFVDDATTSHTGSDVAWEIPGEGRE